MPYALKLISVIHCFVVQSLNCVWLFETPACQASLSFTISWRLCSNSSCPQSFPASGSFPMNWLFTSGSQSIGASALTLDLPMNIQCWFPLGLTGLISLQSKGLSRVLQHHSSKASVLQFSAFFMVQLSHPYMTTGKIMSLTIWTFVGKVVSLLLNVLSRFVIAFLSRSKHLHHIHRQKKRNSMIISMSSGKAHDKIQYPFIAKQTQKVNKLETEGNILNLIKNPVQMPTANNTLNGKRLNAFPLQSRKRKDVCYYLFYLVLPWRS